MPLHDCCSEAYVAVSTDILKCLENAGNMHAALMGVPEHNQLCLCCIHQGLLCPALEDPPRLLVSLLVLGPQMHCTADEVMSGQL